MVFSRASLVLHVLCILPSASPARWFPAKPSPCVSTRLACAAAASGPFNCSLPDASLVSCLCETGGRWEGWELSPSCGRSEGRLSCIVSAPNEDLELEMKTYMAEWNRATMAWAVCGLLLVLFILILLCCFCCSVHLDKVPLVIHSNGQLAKLPQTPMSTFLDNLIPPPIDIVSSGTSEGTPSSNFTHTQRRWANMRLKKLAERQKGKACLNLGNLRNATKSPVGGRPSAAPVAASPDARTQPGSPMPPPQTPTTATSTVVPESTSLSISTSGESTEV